LVSGPNPLVATILFVAVNTGRRFIRMSEEKQGKEKEMENRKRFSGLFIPAGLFIGMGVGWAIDNFLPGMFIGLGIGFFCFAVAMVFVRD